MNTVPTYRRGRRVFTPGERRKGPCDKFLSIVMSLLFLFAPLVIIYFTENNRYNLFTSLSETFDMDILELSDTSTDITSLKAEDVVHGSPTKIDSSTSDLDMGITIQDSLFLQRKTEYCQWDEIRGESCESCSRTSSDSDGNQVNETYDCNCVTTFDYVKSWRSHRINSLLFDQPAAHHNPQRDPLPSTNFVSRDALVHFSSDHHQQQQQQHDSSKKSSKPVSEAIFNLAPSMLENGIKGSKSRTVKWVRGGIPPIPPFWLRWMPDKSRYEDSSDLANWELPGFTHVGDGYFFSAFQASRNANLFKYFMQYLEGTLFDWQIGDLMPSCEAGDIRIRYDVQDPMDVSILGQVSSHSRALNLRNPVIQPIKTSNGRDVGLVHYGFHTAEDMIIAEDWDSFMKACILRLLLLLWSIAITRSVGSKVFAVKVSDAKVPTQIALTLSVWCSVVGIVWTIIWGVQLDDIILLFASALFAAFVYQSPLPKSNNQKKKLD
jgi:hypothetical protein